MSNIVECPSPDTEPEQYRKYLTHRLAEILNKNGGKAQNGKALKKCLIANIRKNTRVGAHDVLEQCFRTVDQVDTSPENMLKYMRKVKNNPPMMKKKKNSGNKHKLQRRK